MSDLDAIRARAEKYANAIGPGGEKAWLASVLAADVPALLAEVERLRTQALRDKPVLDAAEAWVQEARRLGRADASSSSFTRELVAAVDARVADSPRETGEAEPEFLIWSHHHKMWFAPKGCGYRRDITDAGRFTADETKQWMGRGCYCCAVPELAIPAPGPDILGAVGRTGPWVAAAIKLATDARFEAGDINHFANPAGAA